MAGATYMVECFWPGVTPELIEEAAARASRRAEELAQEGVSVRYLGSILVPGDEVVFFQLDGPSAEAVAGVAVRAELPFERVVESVRIATQLDKDR